MVLVDTSVWIRFLANRAPHAAHLDRLLEDDEAAGHDLVQGELLIGDPGGRSQLLVHYAVIHRIAAARHTEIVEFVKSHNLHGLGIGWIDAHLLYSAIVNHVDLWTADERLAGLAKKAGVGYLPGAS